MKKLLFFSLIIISFLSCVDKDYDKDISTEVEIFSDGISLPIGQTEKLTLSSFLKDIDYLKVDEKNGNYYLSLIDSFINEVPEIDRSLLTINGVSHSDTLESVVLGRSLRALPSLDFLDTFKFDLSQEVAPEIIAFREISLKEDSDISISIELLGVPTSITDILAVSFEAKIPDFISTNSPNVINNIWSFNKPIVNNKVSEAVSFNKIKKEIHLNNGWLDYSDSLTSKIKVLISGDPSGIPPEDIVAIQNIELVFSISISDIKIKSVSGRINFALDSETTEIDLSDFSDFIQNNPDNVLDLERADILLDIQKNINIDIHTYLDIISYSGGVVKNTLKDSFDIIDDIEKFFLSNKYEEAPNGYEGHNLDIPSLIRNVPEKLEIALSAKTDTNKFFNIDLYQNYLISGGYNLNVPMSFGDDFHIYLKDSIDFSFSTDDIEKFFNSGSIEIYGEILSDFPFDIEMNIAGVDSSGNNIPDLIFDKVSIPSNSFSIKLSSENINSVEKVSFWEIIFDIKTNRVNRSATLNKDSFIQLKNFKLRKTGGILIKEF